MINVVEEVAGGGDVFWRRLPLRCCYIFLYEPFRSKCIADQHIKEFVGCPFYVRLVGLELWA